MPENAHGDENRGEEKEGADDRIGEPDDCRRLEEMRGDAVGDGPQDEERKEAGAVNGEGEDF